MRISTKLVTVALLPIILTAVVFGIYLLAQRQVSQKIVERRVVAEIAREANEVSLLTDHYLMYRDDRSRSQWLAKHDSIGKLLRFGSFGHGEKEALIARARDNHHALGIIFQRLVALTPRGEHQVEVMLAEALLVKSREIYSTATRLNDIDNRELTDIEHRANVIFMASLTALAVVICIISLVALRHIGSAIRGLVEGTERLAAGELGYHVEVENEEELRRLGEAFNSMSARLQASHEELVLTTESLERENAERCRAERDLKQLNDDLESKIVERTRELAATNAVLEGARRHAEKLSFHAHAQAQKQKEQQLRMRRVLVLAREILCEETVEGFLERIVHAAREVTHARYCLCGHSSSSSTFRIDVASRTAEAAPCPPGRVFRQERGGVYLHVVKTMKPLRLTDAELRAHPAWWGLPEGHAPLRGLLAVPLVDEGSRPMGVLMVSDRHGGGDFCEEDQEILELLAGVVAVGLTRLCRCAPPEEGR